MRVRIRNQWSIFQHRLRHRRRTRQIPLHIQRTQQCYPLMAVCNVLLHRHRLFTALQPLLLLLLRWPTSRCFNRTWCNSKRNDKSFIWRNRNLWWSWTSWSPTRKTSSSMRWILIFVWPIPCTIHRCPTCPDRAVISSRRTPRTFIRCRSVPFKTSKCWTKIIHHGKYRLLSDFVVERLNSSKDTKSKVSTVYQVWNPKSIISVDNLFTGPN